LPSIPQYLLKGKGYSINDSDLRFADENVRRGFSRTYEAAILSGDYHSGPLSLIIPFGIWGVIAFVWLMAAGLLYLFRNYRSGDPALKTINTFLLVFFLARLFCFLFVFGGYYSDIAAFIGLLGLSVSLNGSEPYKAEEPTEEEKAEEIFAKGLGSNRLPVPLP
jgi:hypothetical protein